MTCAQIDDFLDQQVSRPTASLPQWVAEHCRNCKRCRKLLELLGGKPAAHEFSPGLQSQIESSLLKSLQPVSPLPSTGRLVLGFLGVFVLLLVLGIMMGGTGARQVMNLWQFAGVGLILGAGTVLLATSLSGLMVPGGYQTTRAKALVVFVAAVFVLALGLLFPWQVEPMFVTAGLRCAFAGFVLMGPASVSFWLLVRRGAVLSPGLAGATTGLLAGLVGPVVLHFGCPIAKAPHLLVWHAGVPIAGALGGALVGTLLGRFSRDRGLGKARRSSLS